MGPKIILNWKQSKGSISRWKLGIDTSKGRVKEGEIDRDFYILKYDFFTVKSEGQL
jgi:hypothetical protein